MRTFKILLISGLLSTSISVYAQKVALVLSGGGAKGIAHVGVIKALREHDIPIDYIAGTSMGGIVAGAYAAGISVEELETIMSSHALRSWVSGDIEKGYNYYYNNEEPNAAFLSLKLSLDSTFNASVTSTLASDLTLNFALAEIFAQPAANAQYNFDSLFIPARIVAADIFTQNEIVLQKGSLSHALRTSLSVPFFYRPIRLDGKYLFDGGIYDNFPVHVAEEAFDPDIIIGVNVSATIYNEYPYDTDEQLLSNSLLYMLLDKTNPEVVPETGIYIEPNLKEYTSFDFSKARSLIDSGYAATIAQMEVIKEKINRYVDCEELTAQRNKFLNKNVPLKFTNINFHGFNSRQRKYISRIFKFNKKAPLYINDIKTGYFRVVSQKYFRTIYPDITYNPVSQAYQLEIYGRPRNNFGVEVGGNIATRNVSQIFLGLEYYYFNNYLLKNSLNFYTGSFYKSAQIKSRLDLPVFNQIYIEPELTYNQWDFIDADDILTKENSSTILYSTDRRFGVNVGFPVGAEYKGVLRSSYINNTDNFSNTTSFTSSDTLDVLDIKGWRHGVSISKNSLNRKQYANEGSQLRASFDYYSVTEEHDPGSTAFTDIRTRQNHSWFKAKVSAQRYFRRGTFSVGYLAEGVYSNQPFFSNYYSTMINAPAFTPLQDSKTLILENLRAHSYLAFGLRNVVSLRSNLDFRLEGYVFKPLQAIREGAEQQPFYDDSIERLYATGSAGFVLHGPIGPISLSANYYDDDESSFGVLLHLGFLLFQDKSME